MTAEERVRVLAAVFAILTLALIASFLASPAARRATELGRLFEGDASEVARVELIDRGTSLVLEREGEAWVLLDAALRLPVRSERVESLLAELGERRTFEEAARTDAALARLGLAEGAAALRLLDASGRGLMELRAGDFDADGTSIYVAVTGRAGAWAVDRSIADYLDPARARWLELSMGGTKVGAEEATALEVRGALTLDPSSGERYVASYRLARGMDGLWHVEGGGEALLDQGRVDSLARMLLGLEADDVAGTAVGGAAFDLALTLELGGARREWKVRTVAGGFEVETNLKPWRYAAGAARLRSVLVPLESLFED